MMLRMTPEETGTAIRRARQRRRWTQAEAAERLGVSVRTIGDWERGTKLPRNVTIVEDVFGISLANGVPPDPHEEELRGHVAFLVAEGLMDPADADEVVARYRAKRNRPPETRAG
jgi:transcriptional regulator with XRE-family HTH domain